MRRPHLRGIALLSIFLFAGCLGAGEWPFTALIDGEDYPMPSTNAVKVWSDGTDHLLVRGTGGDSGPAGWTDVGAWLSVNVRLNTSALAELTPGTRVPFSGTVTYAADQGFSSLDDEDIDYRPTEGGDVVTQVYSYVSCYCARYGTQEQQVTGSLTLRSFDGSYLEADVEATLVGTIPFYDHGSNDDVTLVTTIGVATFVEN